MARENTEHERKRSRKGGRRRGSNLQQTGACCGGGLIMTCGMVTGWGEVTRSEAGAVQLMLTDGPTCREGATRSSSEGDRSCQTHRKHTSYASWRSPLRVIVTGSHLSCAGKQQGVQVSALALQCLKCMRSQGQHGVRAWQTARKDVCATSIRRSTCDQPRHNPARPVCVTAQDAPLCEACTAQLACANQRRSRQAFAAWGDAL